VKPPIRRAASAAGLILFCLLSTNARGEPHVPVPISDTLSGALPRLVKAGTYLVNAGIEVPPDRTVTIEAGTVFLFRSFAGLHVTGRLLAVGTREKPIVLTSEFDSRYNPTAARSANPYDWDGVYIRTDGVGTHLGFVSINYSVYGLRSDTKFIRLDPLALHANGASIVSIDKTEHPAGTEPFRYVLATTDATIDGVPVRLLEDPLARRRTAVRTLSLIGAIGGLAVAIWQGNDALEKRDAFLELQQDTPRILNSSDNADWLEARSQRNRAYATTIGAGLLSALGIVGFSWTFTF
jgi:hypothetical protein